MKSTSPLNVIFLGDSNVRYFRRAFDGGLLFPHQVSGCEIGGATAIGMRNPNSLTNAVGQFRGWMKDKPRTSVVLIQLGEVDCGYVMWYRAEKYSETVEQQMQASIAAYFEFVDFLLKMKFRHIVITGAALPTITDDDQVAEVIEKRSAVKIPQSDRTALTLQYNEALESEAAKRNLDYVDVSDAMIDPATGLVSAKFRNKKATDHHMEGYRAAIEWAARLNPVLDTLSPPMLDRRVYKAPGCVKTPKRQNAVASCSTFSSYWSLPLAPSAAICARERNPFYGAHNILRSRTASVECGHRPS